LEFEKGLSNRLLITVPSLVLETEVDFALFIESWGGIMYGIPFAGILIPFKIRLLPSRF
jgi:hypothetical protein